MVDAKPSKSALKREDQALKVLGEELIGLKPAQLDQLPLGERLRDAIDQARGMRAHGALRRQRQLIGKLLRQSDATSIREALASLSADSVAEKRRFRDAEAWRDRLVAEGFDTLDACVATTGADAGTLRELLKQAGRTGNVKQQKTARRELFRVIYSALDTNTGS